MTRCLRSQRRDIQWKASVAGAAWVLRTSGHFRLAEEYLAQMKQLMVAMAILGFMAGCATQPHNTVSEKPQVSAVINGKQMELVPEVRARLVEKSVALLSSCVFSDLHPQENLAGALKQSHLRFTFSPPRKVEVPVEKITVGVSEMVITLPLSSGGI